MLTASFRLAYGKLTANLGSVVEKLKNKDLLIWMFVSNLADG